MQTTAYFLAPICIIFVIFFGLRKNQTLIRESNKEDSPYSLARSQLWFWSIIIPAAAVMLWGNNAAHVFSLNKTALILLGITTAVTLTANGIVSAKKANNRESYVFKEALTSKGWFTDVITDETGQFSITRLQNVVFTFIYMVIFISTFLHDKFSILPEFDDMAFTLMGLSGAAYIAGKGITTKP